MKIQLVADEQLRTKNHEMEKYNATIASNFDVNNNNSSSSNYNSNDNNPKVASSLLPLMIIYVEEYLKYAECKIAATTTTTPITANTTAAISSDKTTLGNSYDITDRDLDDTVLNIYGHTYNEHKMALHMWTTERFELYLYEILHEKVIKAVDHLLFGEHSRAYWAMHLIEYDFVNFTSKYLVQQVLNCYNCEAFRFYIKINSCRVSIEPAC